MQSLRTLLDVSRGRGLPVTGTKLMLSIQVVACRERQLRHPDETVDRILSGQRFTTFGSGALRGIPVDSILHGSRAATLGSGAPRARTEGEEAAMGLNDHSATNGSPFAQMQVVTIGTTVVVLACAIGCVGVSRGLVRYRGNWR